jgi:hypothetical protein
MGPEVTLKPDVCMEADKEFTAAPDKLVSSGPESFVDEALDVGLTE